MRVLLINPPFQRLAKVFNTYFPLGIGYVAAVLEQEGHFVRIYNADKDIGERDFSTTGSNAARVEAHDNYIGAIRNIDHYVWSEIRQRVKDFQPDIIGIQSMTSTFPSVRIVARIAKDVYPEVPIMIGGVHPSTVPDEVMTDENVDFAVCGEGELTTLELVQALLKRTTDFSGITGLCYRDDNQIKKNPPREFIKDLDSLPFPARHLVLDPELYSSEFGAIVMGRGCPYMCTFCSAKVLWTRKVRSRSAANVIAEIKHVKEKYGVRSFAFQDDTLTFDKKRLLDLCYLLIDSGLNIHWSSFSRVDVITDEILPILKKSGCYNLGFGIESGSERTLRVMKKHINLSQAFHARELLKKHGIEFSCCFLIGTPDETKEDLRASIEFLRKLKPDTVNVCTYTPYPGTEMYERALELGVTSQDLDHLFFSHHSSNNMFSGFMTPDEFVELRKEIIALADSMGNRLDIAFFKSMARLMIRDPRYFISRVPHYIKIFPSYLRKAYARYPN
jgi:radical SAM superfamily enzyme YgiQ (UPF0313 family)